MTTMTTLRPLIRQMVFNGRDTLIIPERWAEAYELYPDSDVTADAITMTIDEFRIERDEIEAIRAREEATE